MLYHRGSALESSPAAVRSVKRRRATKASSRTVEFIDGTRRWRWRYAALRCLGTRYMTLRGLIGSIIGSRPAPPTSCADPPAPDA
eukprot:1415010-Prymnesium_polylepis.1